MKEVAIQGMVWGLAFTFFVGLVLALCLRFSSRLRRPDVGTDWAVKHLIPPRSELSDSGRITHSFLVASWSLAAVLILSIAVFGNLER